MLIPISKNKMRTGLIGLGAMGQGMARNLAKAGYLCALYNRSPATTQTLAAELHVSACESVEQLAKAAQLIISCVPADKDVLEITQGLATALQPGSIVIDTSTISSATARQVAQQLAQHGIHFLDAPVSGGVEGANKGSLVMMVGGDSEVLAQATPVLQSMASRILHLGIHGNGQACKAVNQIMAAGINQAVCEALAFAEAQQLDLHQVIDTLSAGAAGNWFLQHRGHNMANGVYQPGFKLSLHHKDLRICLAMAEQSASSCPITATTLNDYGVLMAQGHGNDDISGLFRLKRQPRS